MAEKRLGRGLGSLLSAAPPRSKSNPTAGIDEIPVASIYPNRSQPRKTFDLETISQLAASMDSSGLISPILVCRDSDGRFELIAGERRWRAACQLGWETVRAQVRDATDRERLELALIENVQREDLNAIDRALAYEELVRSFSLTHEEVANRIGQGRSTLTNLLRLLELPDDIQDSVRDGAISPGHARALLAVDDDDKRRELWQKVKLEGMSVRALEARIQETHGRPTRNQAQKSGKPPQVQEMEQTIARHLGTKVRITPRGEGGRISIEYFSIDDFERILIRMRGGQG